MGHLGLSQFVLYYSIEINRSPKERALEKPHCDLEFHMGLSHIRGSNIIWYILSLKHYIYFSGLVNLPRRFHVWGIVPGQEPSLP